MPVSKKKGTTEKETAKSSRKQTKSKSGAAKTKPTGRKATTRKSTSRKPAARKKAGSPKKNATVKVEGKSKFEAVGADNEPGTELKSKNNQEMQSQAETATATMTARETEAVPTAEEPVREEVMPAPKTEVQGRPEVQPKTQNKAPEAGIENNSAPLVDKIEENIGHDPEPAERRVRNGLSATDEVQLVCFNVTDAEFGVDIQRVQEIIRMVDINALPDSPPHVLGMIDLRGRVIPVIDLRRRLSLPVQENDRHTRIVVIDQGNGLTGFVVDSVTQVLRISTDRIVDTPEMASTPGKEFLSGIYQQEEKLILVLDCDLIFDS